MSAARLARFLPFLQWMAMLTPTTIRKDLFAGLTGAVIVVPQGVAFATIAGMPPEYGLYTAMVTPIFAALFGSSLHLISGPTTAISIVIFSTMSIHAQPGSPEFIEYVLTVTFLAGVYQLAFGLVRLGSLVNFVSHTVVVAFTTGAAVLIVVSQLKHIVGVDVELGSSFAHTLFGIFQHVDSFNYYVISTAVVTCFVSLLSARLFPRSPNLLIGLIVGSFFCYFIDGMAHGVTMVGAIPAELPPLSTPNFSLDIIRELAPQAFAIALLGLIEAVSIGRCIGSKSHQRINGSQEFIGQGVSNIAGSFFSCYAGSGSFTRTGVNYSAGAQTPLSAIFAAIFLMLLVLSIAPLAAHLPVAAMGGVILIVAYNLIETHHIAKIFKISRSETAVMIVTFLATLFLHLEFAIYIGVFLSLVIFLGRTSMPDVATLAPDPDDPRRCMTNIHVKPLKQCPQMKIIRIDMSVYFGSLDNIQQRINKLYEQDGVKFILIIATGINFIDVSGAEMLVQEQRRIKKLGGGIYLCRLKSSVYNFLDRSGFVEDMGQQYFCQRELEAIGMVFSQVNKHICGHCDQRIFFECQTIPRVED
jgi:sulfate permease, SulP family